MARNEYKMKVPLDNLEASGRLTAKQAGKFVELILDDKILRLPQTMRVHCLRCGVSWPFMAPELCCTCAPNEMPKGMKR